MKCVSLLINFILLVIVSSFSPVPLPFSPIPSSYKPRPSYGAAMFGALEPQQVRDLVNILSANLYALQTHVPNVSPNVTNGSFNQVINVGAAANSSVDGTAGNANGINYAVRTSSSIPTKRYRQHNKYDIKHGQRAIKHHQQRAALKIQAIAPQNGDHCPFNKLPIELRMKIFKYLLPDVRVFGPTSNNNPSRVSAGSIQTLLRTVNSGRSSAVNGNIDFGNSLLSPATLPDANGSPRYFVTSRPLQSFHRLYWEENPGKMALPLMLTNRKICSDVATILYEESTFEIHIHEDGLEFLNLPRLNIVKDHGLLENILYKETKFKDVGFFCFRRIKHPRFVLFGGSPSDRTAGMRMRQVIAKLVELFEKEEKPLTSVEVEFRLESGYWFDDDKTFWVDKATASARRSLWHSVTNIELVTSPLLRLRNIGGKISLTLPCTVTNADDISYKESFEHTLKQSADYVCESQFKPEFDNALMDSVVGYQLQNATVPVDNPCTAFVPLLTEEDILADVEEEEEDDKEEEEENSGSSENGDTDRGL